MKLKIENNTNVIHTDKGTRLSHSQAKLLPSSLFKNKYGFWFKETDRMLIHEIINENTGLYFNIFKSNSYHLIRLAMKNKQPCNYTKQTWIEYLVELAGTKDRNRHYVIAGRVLRNLRRKKIIVD